MANRAPSAPRVPWVQRGLTDLMVPPGSRAFRATRVPKECPGRKAHRAPKVPQDPRESRESRDRQGTQARRARRVPLEYRGPRCPRAQRAPHTPAPLPLSSARPSPQFVSLCRQALSERLASRERQVPRECRAKTVWMVRTESRESRAYLVPLAPKASRGSKARLVCLE